MAKSLEMLDVIQQQLSLDSMSLIRLLRGWGEEGKPPLATPVSREPGRCQIQIPIIWILHRPKTRHYRFPRPD